MFSGPFEPKDEPERRDELAAARDRLGLSQETLAEKVGVTAKTVSQWERGVCTPRPAFRILLAEALHLSLSETNRLIGVAEPIEITGHRVPADLTMYDSLVLEAGRLDVYVRSAIPAMLQTHDYAIATERLDPTLSEVQIVERVDSRLTRQFVLHSPSNLLHMCAVMHEGVLRDGGPEMADQLTHLLQVAELPNVEVLVMPADGRARALPGEFELITRQGEADPFMAVVIDPLNPRYHERDDRYLAAWNNVLRAALGPDQSAEAINHIQKEY